jgi:hypothetical protein
MSLKKYKSQGKAVDVNVSSKEENSEDFCLDFVQEFGLCSLESTRVYNAAKTSLDSNFVHKRTLSPATNRISVRQHSFLFINLCSNIFFCFQLPTAETKTEPCIDPTVIALISIPPCWHTLW